MPHSIDVLVEQSEMPLAELAERSGLSIERIDAIVHGRWTPSPDERRRLAEALGVDIEAVSWGHTMTPRNVRYHRFGIPRHFTHAPGRRGASMTAPAFSDSYSENAAENYERYFVPSIGRPVAEGLVEAAALRPGERVLDVACGTGIVVRLAAERVGPRGVVEGLDPNPGMLAIAREVASSTLPTTWHEAPAEAMPLPDEHFDVVLCGMGLQFFSNREAGLRQMRRVLVPGGRLLATLPGPAPPPLEAMAEALARHVSPESASFIHAVFSLNDADEIRALATHAGFNGVAVRSEAVALRLPSPAEFLWQYVHSTPMATVVTHLDEQRRDALERDFSERCQPFVKEGALVGAVKMSTLTARR